MRALLISTYDLGRQPFGLASPAAWLRRAGIDVACVDASRECLDDARITGASVIAFYLPMHTATRLAVPLIERARRLNPSARLCAYGLYAPLNEEWLRARGVDDVLGPESEEELVDLCKAQGTPHTAQGAVHTTRGPRLADSVPRLTLIQPDRAGLAPLRRYATLQMSDGSQRIVGSTDATRGCKHLCRHCPIVPVYRGQFRAVPLEVVIADVRSQVEAGAQHISFGDPDFLNGPAHARRLVQRVAGEFAGLTYDVTIKIEHLLEHPSMLPVLRDTGCLFITSAVESIDDGVLKKLMKGHTRADFIRVVAMCRAEGITLMPTFVPFTPWTTVEGYLELLDVIEELDLIEQVAPIQLAIRLLVTSGSHLLELADIRGTVDAFDPGSLTWPWRHQDARVDALQEDVMKTVGASLGSTRGDTFDAIAALAREQGGARASSPRARRRGPVPVLSEAWYCCAEPSPDQLAAI